MQANGIDSVDSIDSEENLDYTKIIGASFGSKDPWIEKPSMSPPKPIEVVTVLDSVRPLNTVKPPKETRPRLSKDGKSLTFHILPEIATMLSCEASVFKNDRNVNFMGRQVTQDSIMNSLLALYFTKRSSQRKKLIKGGLLVVESRMAIKSESEVVENDAT